MTITCIQKPRPAKAIQWTGDNLEEVKDFLGETYSCETDALGYLNIKDEYGSFIKLVGKSYYMIKTLNSYGDSIIISGTACDFHEEYDIV